MKTIAKTTCMEFSVKEGTDPRISGPVFIYQLRLRADGFDPFESFAYPISVARVDKDPESCQDEAESFLWLSHHLAYMRKHATDTVVECGNCNNIFMPYARAEFCPECA